MTGLSEPASVITGAEFDELRPSAFAIRTLATDTWPEVFLAAHGWHRVSMPAMHPRRR